jgi:probable phosphoglycerate mutase
MVATVTDVVTTILLTRHGETDWNRDQRVQGHTDRPLNDTGRAQAEELARTLADEPLDAVYASDLSRAHETARAVAEGRGLPVRTEASLREKSFGTWEGLTGSEIQERFPDALQGHWGDGEQADEMAARVLEAVRRIAVAHPGERVLVVSHGGPLRAVLRHCNVDLDGPIGNCAVIRIAVDGARIDVLD